MNLVIDDNTSFNYTVPLSPSDGNLIGLSTNGAVNLIFYQTRKQSGNHIDSVDVIGAILMPTVQDLKNFRDAITDVIKQHEEGEK